MKNAYSISAVITTLSPLHITEPGDSRVGLDGRDAKGSTGFPCPRTTKMWLNHQPNLSEIANAPEGEDEDGGNSSPVPHIPPNSLRGPLRRQAAAEIMDALVARGESLSINAYNVLQCGAASGAPDGTPATVQEAIQASNHPYLGLFGGGPRLIRSNLRVDSALAITPISLPYLRPEFAGVVNPKRLLSVGWRRRNDDALWLTDIERQSKILVDFNVEINAYQDNAFASKAAAKAKGSEDPADAPVDGATALPAPTRGLEAFNALEYVVPGVHFALRLDLNGTEEQAGLLLTALLRLVQKNRLGGDGRRGFGRFMLQSIVLSENGERTTAGSKLTESSVGYEGRAAELVQAWERARSLLSAGEIEAFAKPSDKPAPPKKETRAAKAPKGGQTEA